LLGRASAELRLPLLPPSDANCARIGEVLVNLHLLS